MQHKTLPLMGARRPASGKAAAIILVEFVFAFFFLSRRETRRPHLCLRSLAA